MIAKISYEVSNSIKIELKVKEFFNIKNENTKDITTQVIREMSDEKIDLLVQKHKEIILKQVADGMKRDDTWIKFLEAEKDI